MTFRNSPRWPGGTHEWMAGASAARGYSGEAGQKLLSANTAQDVLTAVVDEIADSADFCLVLQMGTVPGADFEMVAVWDAATGPGAAPGRRIPYALLAPFFEVARRGAEPEGAVGQGVLETAVVTDAAQDARITPGFAEMLAATGARSFVAVPMGSGVKTHALFVVGRRRAGRFRTRLVRQYEGIAGQLAGVLHNMALLEESRARAAQLEAVAEVSSAVSSILDPAELLAVTAELIRERFDLYYVGIFLLDADGGRVVLRAGTGPAGQQMVEAGHHFTVGEESMIGWCVANRRARIALDVGQEAAPGVQGFVRFDNPLLPDTRSELALPLMTRGPKGTQVLVGAMTIQSTRQAAFDEGDVTVLLVMADQLANAIENARLFQERERRMTQMGIVNEIGQALSMGMDLNVLFALVHEQVGRLFDADNFYIAVYEEGREFWELAFSVEGGERQPQARHSVSAGLTGWILRHRAPILLPSRDENTAFHTQQGIPTIGPRACSWLGVPLVTSQKLVGAMGIQDYHEENLYDESDRALFETIAAQVATVLDNSRLLEATRKRAREMEVINEVGQVVTSVLDLDEVLRRLVDVTKEEFGYYFVNIALVHERGMEVRYGSRIGDTERRLALTELVLDLESERSLVAECARTGKPVLVGDVQSDERYLFLDDLPETRSELTVPIVTKVPEGTQAQSTAPEGTQAQSTAPEGTQAQRTGHVIGTLDVQSDERFAFDETDVAVLQLLAGQAGTAIENARLFAETRRRADEMAVLHRVSLELAQEQQDLRTVLETITRRTMDLLDSDGGGVWLWHEGEGELELVVTYQVGDVDFVGRRLAPGEGLTGLAFSQNRIQVVDDYRAWNGKAGSFSDAPFVSAMAIPMRWQAETVGVLVATRSQAGRQYRVEERELGELLAAQAASVIQNAQLFADREARAEELAIVNEVGQAVSSVLDLDEVLQRIVDGIKERLGHFFVGILLVEGSEGSQGGCLVFRSSSAIGDTAVRWQRGELRLALDGYGVTVAVANSGESILVNDVRLDSRYGTVEGLEPVRAELDTPIKVKGQVIGVLTVQSDRLHAFGEGDVKLLQGLASQAGVAIENARLFEQAQAQLSSLAEIQSALAELNAAFTFEQAIAALLPQVARIARADRVRMYLVEGTRMTCVGVHSGTGSDSVRVGEVVSLDDYPLTRQVVETREPLSILSDDARLQPHAREAYQAAGLAANATIALVGRQGVVGVLSMNRHHPPEGGRGYSPGGYPGSPGGYPGSASGPARAFQEQEVGLVQTLANQATMVLEKNQFFEETEQRGAELQSLYEMSLQMSTHMETTELLTVIVERAAGLLGAETAGLYVYEPRSNELVFAVGAGYLTEYVGRQLRPGEGLAGHVFEERQVRTVDDYQAWSGRAAAYEQEGRLGMLLAVPLVSGDRCLGVLELGAAKAAGAARGRAAFKAGDVRLAELFAAQAAIALENAHLFEEAQARAQEQTTLRHIMETVSSSLDTAAMLETTLAQTLSALDLDAGLISLCAHDSGRLVLTAQRGLPVPMVDVLEEKGLGGTLCEYVYLTGETISIGDVREGAPVNVDALIKNGLIAYAGTPLSATGERIGTMCFFHRARREVGDEELRLLEAIGGQVGLGITNARLFQETERRAEELARAYSELARAYSEMAVLNEMGQALTTRLDVGDVLENVSRYAARLMDTSNFYVALYHPERDEVSFPISLGEGRRYNWATRRSGNGLTEYVIRTGEPLLIADHVDDYITCTLGVELIGQVAQSWLGAPLVIGEQVLGMIAVQSYDTPNLYGEHQRDLLMAVASQAAIAVQNARLFEQAEARAEYERLLREITAQVRASTNADTIMRTAVRELGTALDRPAFIRLGRGGSGNREPESRKRDEAVPSSSGEYSGDARRYPGEARGYSGEARGYSGEARGYSGEARGYSGEGGE